MRLFTCSDVVKLKQVGLIPSPVGRNLDISLSRFQLGTDPWPLDLVMVNPRKGLRQVAWDRVDNTWQFVMARSNLSLA